MEDVVCDLCGANDTISYMRRQDRFGDEQFDYVKCRQCGLIYLNPRPRPDEILPYYPDGYEAHLVRPTISERERARRMRPARIQCRMVARYRQQGRLLDVGCGTGEFLAGMQDRGWQVRGVELSPVAAAFARRIYQLDVSVGTLSDYENDTQFDLITLWDVLEHLYSPLQALRRLKQQLANDGYLVLSIPNLASFDRHLFANSWIGWDAPRHLYLFDDAIIRELLALAGFDVIDRRCILGGPGAFRLSLHIWAEQRWGRAVADRGILRLVDRALPLLLWPYKTLAYRLNKGPVITYVARPRKERSCINT